MSEQRLIDATELRRIFDVWLSEMNDNDPEDQQTGTAIYDCACQLNDAPTIDPETLPIVRELWEKLERVTAERNAALKWVKQLKAEKAAAIGELNGVLASVDALTEFIDDEVHPVVDYDLYLRLRDKVDVITQWEHADEWGGKDGDHP